jgi:hypothetical protein
VARGGDYRIRLRLEGQPAAPALVELRRAGDAEARESFSVRPPELPGWVEAGVARLDSGAWTASVSLPLGARLEYVEVAPPCVNAIEPLDGWRATDVTDDEDLAVTLLKAADAEQDLPPAQSPIEVPARRFQRNDAGQLSQAALTEDAFAIKAGARGLRAAVAVEVPEGGLYAVAVFGLEGQGQRWLADGCRNAVVCGAAATDSRPGWHVVLTGDLTAGQHVFTVTLGPGASIERLRLERKRAGGADYVAALRRLGFEAGPAGPVTRARAREAVEWLRQRRLERLGQECGDWDLSPTVEYAQQAGQEPTPGGEPGIGAGAPPPPRGGNAPPPLSPPVVPPQQPASPVEVAGS